MRKKLIRSSQVGSLLDEPIDSARRMLEACVPTTMSFWIDHESRIHAVLPEKVPLTAQSLIVGTYSIGGTSVSLIEEDLLAERRERAKAWTA
jgi:hypothetical protein